MSASQKKGPAIARVTFIRHQAMIEKEFRAGWSALAIYQRHKEELNTISYRQFLRYVAAWRSTRLQTSLPARPKPERSRRGPSAQQQAPVESTPPRGRQSVAAPAKPPPPQPDQPDEDDQPVFVEPRHRFIGKPAYDRVRPAKPKDDPT